MYHLREGKATKVSEILVSSCGMTSTDAEKEKSEKNANAEGEVTLDQGPSTVTLGKGKKERSKTRTTTTGNLELIIFGGGSKFCALEMVMDVDCRC